MSPLSPLANFALASVPKAKIRNGLSRCLCLTSTASHPQLEARLAEGSVFKKVMDAIKDLINEVNFDCNETGISLQSMDTAHVALVVLLIKAESFDPYRCDRSMSLGALISLH